MNNIKTLADLLDMLKEAADEVASDLEEECDESKTWEDHEGLVADAEDCEVATIVSLLDSVVRDTLNELNSGLIVFENGNEMLATVKAVAILESLKAK